MCGIAGLYIGDPDRSYFGEQDTIETFVNALLLGIEPRGRDATGVVSVGAGSDNPVLCKADTEASSFINWRDPLADNPRIVLCHTRLATKGDPKNLLNNHPVKYGSVFVTHNGHISNDDELFAEHKLDRIAQVDTEIIPAMLDLKGINKAHLALQELIGNMAIAAIDPVRFPDALLLAKGFASPLEYLDLSDGSVVWASTKEALNSAWQSIWPGRHPKREYFKDLRAGELLLFEDGEHEKLEFKVKDRSYNSNWEYDWSSSGTRQSPYTYINVGDPRLRDLCECGQYRYWHAGNAHDGSCIKTYTMEGGRHRVINCNGFKKLPIVVRGSEDIGPELTLIDGRTLQETNYRQCLGCRTAFPVNEMVSIGGHLVCSGCNAEATEDHDDDDLFNSDRGDAAEILQVAEELGIKPAMVEYLLFEAEDADFDADPWLIQIYCAVDDAYSTALRQGEEAWKRQLELDAEGFECGVPIAWTCHPCEKSVFQHNCPECGRSRKESEEVATA